MDDILERQVLAKVIRRLVPFMILLYIFNYLDRVNISLAKLQMNDDLHLDDSVYAVGAAVFYLGYCLFEVPSNLIMVRVGARRWIARIMISWGLVSTSMMFIKGPASYYTLRFLLGVAEAGFFPGIILYLTYWIPSRDRARAGAILMTATAFSGVIGNLLADQIFKLNGQCELAGWQWLFLLEGVPTVLLGFIVLIVLVDSPEKASWLDEDERAILDRCLKADRGPHVEGNHMNIRPAFTDGKVWRLIGVYCAILIGFYAIQYWTPTIIREVLYPDMSLRLSSAQLSAITRLNSIPFLSAAGGMVFVGWNSDRTGERVKHVAACCFLASLGFIVTCVCKSSLPLTIAGLSLSAIGSFGTLGPFWALPPAFLRGTAAAAGIALINAMGNFGGGYLGQTIMGKLKDDKPNSYVGALEIFASVLFLAGCLALTLRTTSAKSTVAVIPELK